MTKRFKYISVVVIFAVALVAGGVLVWRSVYLTKEEKVLKNAFEQTKKLEVSPSSVDPNKTIMVTKYINEGKYNEARVLIDELLQQKNLLESDTRALKANLQVVCSKQQDLECMQKLINEQKNNNTLEVFIVLDTASIAEKKQNLKLAKQLYRQAKEIIDAKGGRSYLDEVNQNTDSPINYDDIVRKAQ